MSSSTTQPAAANPEPGRINAHAQDAGDSPPDGPRLKTLMGWRFDDRPRSAVAQTLVTSAARGAPQQVCFVNAHCANVAYADADYNALLQKQPTLYADGIGMRIASRLAGCALDHNVNGTDLFDELCSAAQAADVGIALLGAKPGTTDRCVVELAQRYPGLRVVWHRHGYLTAEQEREALAELNTSGAGLLFVAKGVPLQERWIAQHAETLNVPVVLGVGALLDFVAGNVQRAPELVRRLSLEWLYRFLQEPRRLFQRYLLGNPLFLLRVVRAWRRGDLLTAEWRN